MISSRKSFDLKTTDNYHHSEQEIGSFLLPLPMARLTIPCSLFTFFIFTLNAEWKTKEIKFPPGLLNLRVEERSLARGLTGDYIIRIHFFIMVLLLEWFFIIRARVLEVI